MQDEDSLIKARYARTILRVARTVDRQAAARLVGGLVRDVPDMNERAEVKQLHLAAIESFAQLAMALGGSTYANQQKPWDDATDAAGAWLRTVGG
jgi:hypothetical protein